MRRDYPMFVLVEASVADIRGCAFAAQDRGEPHRSLLPLEMMRHRLTAGTDALPTPNEAAFDRPFALDLVADGIGIIALVGLQDRALGHLLQKQLASRAIGDLAAGQEESDWAAQAVGQGVDLRGSPAARPADRLILLPPLPPEAQR